jgi:hypothetical protein
MAISLSGFCSMSQFSPGLPTGMCGGVAILGANRARPSVAAQGFDLSPTGQRNLLRYMRTHTYRDPNEGVRLLCDADGAMNIYGVYATQKLIASGTHVLVDYAAYNAARFTADIRTYAGRRAILVEFSNGQALISDEHGLHYHFDCIGGVDPTKPCEGEVGCYQTCDGDSAENLRPARANPPIDHTRQTLLAAVPIAYVICA